MMESGHSRRRVEDARFLTGQGQFVDDLARPGELHGHVLRAPCGHGDFVIGSLDAARAAPGVVAIYTEADLRAAGVGPLPCVAKVATMEPLIVPPRPALAAGRVRHVGDPVAFVVAETRNAARDAAELIAVEYDILPALSDSLSALAPGAVQLWPQAPGNLAFRFQKGDKAAVSAALASAAHIIEIALVNNRVTAAPMETRVAIGAFDEAAGFDLVLSGQGVHPLRDQLADDVFHVPRDRVHLMCPDVGGGFGAKNFLYPEYVLVLFAARALGRPVRWVGDRGEDFLSSSQGRDNHTTARLGLDASGKFLALEVRNVADMGAYLSTSGPGSPTNAASTAMGGLYDIPAIFMDVRAAFTNTGACCWLTASTTGARSPLLSPLSADGAASTTTIARTNSGAPLGCSGTASGVTQMSTRSPRASPGGRCSRSTGTVTSRDVMTVDALGLPGPDTPEPVSPEYAGSTAVTGTSSPATRRRSSVRPSTIADVDA